MGFGGSGGEDVRADFSSDEMRNPFFLSERIQREKW